MGNTSSNNSSPKTSSSLETEMPSLNPLLMPEILHCIFEWLRGRDLKECRLVCHTWNTVGRPYLGMEIRLPYHKIPAVKRVKKIVDAYSLSTNMECVGYYYCKMLNETFTPEYERIKRTKLYKDFEKSKMETVHSCAVNAMRRIGDEYKTYSKFKGVNLLLIDGPNIVAKCCDISPILIGRNLTKLSIMGRYECKAHFKFTPIVLSLNIIHNELSSLKILSLTDCELQTTIHTPRISLLEINLIQVVMVKEGKEISTVNEIFNFMHTRVIRLKYDRYFTIQLNMDDVTDGKPFTNIYLSGIIILNWISSKWSVNKLTIEDINSFDRPDYDCSVCQMKIKELEFISCGKIHISFLPITIERLQIYSKDTTEEFLILNGNQSLMHLEKLKHLCLNCFLHCSDEDMRSEVAVLLQCQSLSDIHFGFDCIHTVDMIHSRVENLVAHPSRFNSLAGNSLGWEQLIVIQKSSQYYSNTYCINSVHKFYIGVNSPRRVVISLPDKIKDSAFDKIFCNNVIQKLQTAKVLYIGPMKWNPKFERNGFHEFSNLNKNQYNFFVFENKVARPIGESEFRIIEKDQQCIPCKNNLNLNFDKRAPYNDYCDELN